MDGDVPPSLSGILASLKRVAAASGSTVELQSHRGGEVFTQTASAEMRGVDFRMMQARMCSRPFPTGLVV
jgi:hypothetical protein